MSTGYDIHETYFEKIDLFVKITDSNLLLSPIALCRTKIIAINHLLWRS